jgi:hypothetical protein
MAEDRDLGAMARAIIDANHFMTLATADPDGHPDGHAGDYRAPVEI